MIYPPVRVSELATTEWRGMLSPRDEELLSSLPKEFVLGASRFVPYKALHEVIRVGEILDSPVVLAGSGPDEARLRAIADQARVPVHFVSSPTDALLFSVMSAARLFVFPAVEDFGIMPVEAIALGTPVLVNEIGGAAEIIKVTGAGRATNFASSAGIADSARAALELSVDSPRAQAFSVEAFKSNVRNWIEGNSPVAI